MTRIFPPFDPKDTAPRDNGKRERRGRRLRIGKRGVPIRVLVPNFFTLLGLCAGLTAIRMAIEGRYDIALALVVLAALLDGVDGRVARLLKASSRFGAELDSLADFVNFGVAPAIVVFTWALVPHRSLGWIVVLVFALCSALRLARFNAALDDDRPKWQSAYFEGVPAPAAAILVLLPLYLDGLGLTVVKSIWGLIMLYTLAIAFLMVSRIPTFSGKLWGERVSRDYVLPVFVLAVLFVALLVTYPYLTLTASSLIYLAAIPWSVRRFQRRETAEKAAGGHEGEGRARARDGAGASAMAGAPAPEETGEAANGAQARGPHDTGAH